MNQDIVFFCVLFNIFKLTINYENDPNVIWQKYLISSSYMSSCNSFCFVVAFTACAQSGLYYDAGSIIKFPLVRTHIETDDLSAFQSSGKFNCTMEGLYHLTVSILSDTVSGRFDIYHNGSRVYHTYISNDGKYEMSTAVLAISLKIHDTVWVQSVTNSLTVDAEGSCFTIIKVK